MSATAWDDERPRSGHAAGDTVVPLDQPTARELPSIEVDRISASYRVRIDSKDIMTDIRRLFRRVDSGGRVIPALRDVSFDVPKGSVLAVIGRNGAGKSTLCRVIMGILPPDEGRVTVRGRLNLLSPGLGFSAALTGRENIILGGLASGLSPERLAEIADEIAEFAQLADYLDMPMHSYSSGMRMRLASSVAVFLEPEILLIDEALTGGDAAFMQHIADGTADRRGPHDRARDPRAQLGQAHGHPCPVAAPGPGGRARRPRRGREQVHAVLPARIHRLLRRVTARP
jgi:ABC-type polysaccharide/polyol phosphate transport system ATPase subunit